MRFLMIPVVIAAILAGAPMAFAAGDAPAAPAVPAPEPNAVPAPNPPAPSELDGLFTELKNATSLDSAKAAEAAILQRFLRSGSDTVDLLMSWAIESMNSEDYPLALDILDSVVAMKPDVSRRGTSAPRYSTWLTNSGNRWRHPPGAVGSRAISARSADWA
jgi:hypothetical protein